MNINEEEEIKKEFQLERVILFTDAVFAIILTIMVLDLKLPDEVKNMGNKPLIAEWKSLVLKFTAYLITFALVARFWMVHLKLFRFLKDYNTTLLIYNLSFLFLVSLFPFAVSLITRSVNVGTPEYVMGFTIYVCVVYSVMFMQALMARYLLRQRALLCINTPLLEEDFKWKIQRINLILLPVLIATVIGLYCFQQPYIYEMYTILIYSAIIGRLTSSYYPKHLDGPLILRLYKSIKMVRRKKTAVPPHTNTE